MSYPLFRARGVCEQRIATVRTAEPSTYTPGFVHVDVKYQPQMPGERAHHYLFTTIDRASRWGCVEILPDKTAASADGFPEHLIQAAPFRLTKVLTDNGKEFTDRFCITGERKPTGAHVFDQVCAVNTIENRLIKPRHSQTNSMARALQRPHLRGAHHHPLSQRRAPARNAHPLRAGLQPAHSRSARWAHCSPVAALKRWHQEHPELFRQQPQDQTGLDIRSLLRDWGFV